MKKYLFVVLSFLILASCNNDESPANITIASMQSIELGSQSYELTFSSEGDWNIAISNSNESDWNKGGYQGDYDSAEMFQFDGTRSWLNVQPMYGKAGTCTIKIKRLLNEDITVESSYATIVIYTNDKKLVIPVKADFIKTTSDYNVAFNDTTLEIPVVANVDFDLLSKETAWIEKKTIEKVNDNMGQYLLKLNIAKNMSPSTRSTSIEIGQEKIKEAISVNQAAGPEAIDLGLSVKWASFNVGGTKPEEYGPYFAWGETFTKSIYTDETYTLMRHGDGWTTTDSIYDIGRDISKTQYDAAYVMWGSPWRMPTKDECQELIDKCTWNKVTRGDINGCEIIGPNGNKIFLSAGGRMIYGFDHSWIHYWTSTNLDISSSSLMGANGMTYEFRNYGASIRAVSDD